MDADTFLDRLERLTVWRRRNERAPHKPLLLLHAISRIGRGEERMMPFGEVRRPLERLLVEFGPARAQVHPEYPFWRLERDGVWEVDWPPPMRLRERRVDPSAAELEREGVTAGFTPEVHSLLAASPSLRRRAASILLWKCYPPTYHEEILGTVGLEADWETIERRVRDPLFRRIVLEAWEHRCGVCGFDLEFDRVPLALDAAHVRWKQYEGPDHVSNGIALCALHHRLFDRGAFTLRESAGPSGGPVKVAVSGRVTGGPTLRTSLIEFHRKPLVGPRDARFRLDGGHLKWHRVEVFKGPHAG